MYIIFHEYWIMSWSSINSILHKFQLFNVGITEETGSRTAPLNLTRLTFIYSYIYIL
jgi:hypothetical protein